MALVKIEQTAVGALTKKEAIEFVGGPEVFAILEKQYGVVPFFKSRTLFKYRVAGLENAMLQMELAAMQEHRKPRP